MGKSRSLAAGTIGLINLFASAFFDGKRGADALDDSLTLDSSLIDNKAGIGTYLYWRSEKSGVVKYLLFWGDKKKEGNELWLLKNIKTETQR